MGQILPQLKKNSNCLNNDNKKQRHVAGECPRCKRLLLLEAKNLNNSSSRSRSRTSNVSRTSSSNKRFRYKVQLAKSPHIMWYASKRGMIYRFLLLTIVLANPHYIPIELLVRGEDDEFFQNLCQWGLIHKKTDSNTNNTITSSVLMSHLRRHCSSRIPSLCFFLWRFFSSNQA
jgi:hypothetical protein